MINRIKQIRNYNGKYKFSVYMSVYTVTFCVISAIVLSYFYLDGKLFVGIGDGTVQDYSAFLYWSRYLKSIVATLINEHRLIIPLWDSSIGFGEDIIMTLQYYVAGDPTNLLAIFAPEGKSEICYCLLILFKLYLAGLFFSIFSLRHNNSRLGTLCGSFIYIFSGFVLLKALFHLMFLVPVLYFPLVLIGIDNLLNDEKKKPGLFIAAVALAAYSNFYFLYMIAIMSVMYFVFAYIKLYGIKDIKHLLFTVLRFAFAAVAGALIAAPILIPVVMQLLNMNRFGADNYFTVLYQKNYYLTLITSFMTTEEFCGEYWTVMGYTAAGLFGIFVLFAKKGKDKFLKTGFILMVIFTCIPAVGLAFNGFSYICNRWNFALAFFVAFVFSKEFNDFSRMQKEEMKRVVSFSMIYALIVLCFGYIKTKIALLMLALLFILIMVMISASMNIISKEMATIVITAVLVIGLAENSAALFSPRYGGSTSQYQTINALRGETKNTLAKAVKGLADDGNYRYDKADSDTEFNINMIEGVDGTNFYYSIFTGFIGQFHKELELYTPQEYRISDLNGRSMLQAISNIGYYVKKSTDTYLPYGINSEAVNVAETYKGNYEAFEKEKRLPLGYTYSECLSLETYEKLTAVQKEAALLQAVVINEESVDLPEIVPEYFDERMEYTIEAGEDIIISEGAIRAMNDNATFDIIYSGKPASENYLEIKNYDYIGILPSDGVDLDSLPKDERRLIKMLDDSYYTDSRSATTVAANDHAATYVYRNNRNTCYCGKHDFIYNAGYFDEPLNRITVTLKYRGLYTFDEINVFTVDVKRSDKYIEKLAEETLYDINMGVDEISGSIDISGKKVLLLAIPYSKGWTAYVDGKKAELLRANTMYSALELEEGHHNIRLNYITPGLSLGAGCMVLGIILAIIIVVVLRRKRKNVDIS